MSILKNIFKQRKSKPTTPAKSIFHTPNFDKYNEFGQIVTILDYTLNPDFEIANKAAKTVHRLFNSVKVLKNKTLYLTFRYLKINKSDINKFRRFDKEIEITLLCITSMNGNGYSREKALTRLIELKMQRTIPFILFRLADWITPIREKAEAATTNFLTAENTIYFIQNHKLINWLLHIERTDLSELYNQIIKSIISNKSAYERIITLNDGERFFYFKLFAKSGLIDSILINQMLTDKYYLIRFLLIKHLNKLEDLKTTLPKLLSDKSLQVRQGAINLISNQDLKEYEAILKELISDNSTSVRFKARTLLSKISDYDYKKMYRVNISNNHNLIGSILGLSEVSDKIEVPIFQDLLDSKKGKIRSASLIGIYNIDNKLGIETAYKILESNNTVNTRRVAESILAKEGININRLRNLYDVTDLAGKRIILRLFNRYCCWSVAGDYIKALTDSNKKIQLMARVFLESWNNYTIGLATKQNTEDKNYVLGWYKKANDMNIQVPKNIPFIFRDK